jgi:preprotein translocase subunit Sec63
MAEKTLTPRVNAEVQRLAAEYGYSEAILSEFACFVLSKEPKLSKKPLTLSQLKQAVYEYFGVKDTTGLKKSGKFKLAISGMGKLNYSRKESWEAIYRKWIGVLPHEVNEKGRGCINGINIFKYDMPWKAFGLDPKQSDTEDVKKAYRELSRIYHPDNSETGDADIFDRLTVFYKSLTEKF